MKEQNLQSHYHRHDGVPIAIGMNVEKKEGDVLPAEASAQAGSEFTIRLLLV